MPSLTAAATRLSKLLPPAPPSPEKRFMPDFPLEAWGHFGLTPYAHQAAAFIRSARFTVDVWHRRGGKSIFRLLQLLERAASCPFKRGRYAFLAPTYSQVEDIVWSELKALADFIPGAALSEGKLSMEIPTYIGDTARVRLYGIDSPKQRLRGSYLDGVVMDEFQDFPEHVWGQQVRPMLADKSRRGVDRFGRANQWAAFIGTPKARNLLYQFWRRADAWQRGEAVEIRDGSKIREVTSNEWAATLLNVEATRLIPDEELQAIQSEISPTEYAQEFMLDWDAGMEGAILRLELMEAKRAGRIGHFPYNPMMPVVTSWDLGWDDATCIWFLQQIEDRVNIVGFEAFTNASIPSMAKAVRDRGYRLMTNYFPHDVAVVEQGTGRSRASIFRSEGLRVVTVPKPPNIADGIAALRRFLGRCHFDASACALGLDFLALYRREKDKATGLVKTEPVHDMGSHAADALRTAAMGIPRWTGVTNQPTMVEF
jgi:phage terminase large subunit